MKLKCKFIRPEKDCHQFASHAAVTMDEGDVSSMRLLCTVHAKKVKEVILGLVLVNEIYVISIREEKITRQKTT